ncbi:hypothetical protein [uncultured Parabacteroides sp.]|uniref:hypothetical protein n=1 Tax=uncultured Parabacteroides sp. TaxID=512312 RepID=UPI0025DDD014|nr:hypothetical protein [uncultured Parabacteroides sp.]
MIYIQKEIGFWNVEEVLPISYKTGTTIKEYEQGAYLLLSADQVAFHEAHPDASPIECWNMEIPSSPEPEPVPEPDALAIARQEKLQEIADQDEFSNKFFVSVTQGGVEVANQELWIDKDLRNSLYSITLPALQSDGETKTKLWTTGTPPQSIEVPISWAMEKLPLLEIYAKRTYDRRASNEAATYAATTVEEIHAIDVKADYPHFLTFELNLDLGV